MTSIYPRAQPARRRKPTVITSKALNLPAYKPPGQATAPTSSAPPAPTSTPLPPDPGYEQTLAGLAKQRDQGIGDLQAQRAAGLLSYGYNEDPNSGALSFDPNNPYSQAALMKKHYDQSRAGAQTSYAASGHLYGGSLQNARNYLNDQQGQGENALMKSVAQFLAGNKSAQTAAGTNYEIAAGQAQGTSVANAAANPLYTPAAPAAAAPAVKAQQNAFVRPSAAHGGKPWKYYIGANGKPIPIGPA